ncbi:MAG TPA: transglutaminase-like domain-containing protein [Candidatus Thermoplasmatota archaeon]|nr:transglutaminase-like domain-containing protein [Candidatus Thermoplasmatota archaeon]
MTRPATFAQEVGEEDFHLARACLLLSRDDTPTLDVDAQLARFAPWAERVKALRAEGVDVPTALRQALAEEAGFRGAEANEYYLPRNSYLDQVLDTRQGIPITLSIVYLEVARLVNEPLVAMGMPAHFLVRHEETYLDPFHGGREVTRETMQRLLDGITGGRLTLTPAMLAPTSDREILARVLANLRNAYLRQGDLPRAIRTMDRLVELLPDDATLHRDRGLLKHEAGRFPEARIDLEHYLDVFPTARDAEGIRGILRRLQ